MCWRCCDSCCWLSSVPLPCLRMLFQPPASSHGHELVSACVTWVGANLCKSMRIVPWGEAGGG